MIIMTTIDIVKDFQIDLLVTVNEKRYRINMCGGSVSVLLFKMDNNSDSFYRHMSYEKFIELMEKYGE